MSLWNVAIRILLTAKEGLAPVSSLSRTISFARHLQMQIFSDVSAVFLLLAHAALLLAGRARTTIENAIARNAGAYKKAEINLPS